MADCNTQPETGKDEQPSSTDERNGADSEVSEKAALSRREVIRLAANVLLAAPLVGLPETQAATTSTVANEAFGSQSKALHFFTREEFALLDELSELIIPTDEHSPGARAAGVATYIDKRLAESFTQEPKQVWRAGLKLIESISQEMHGRPFLQSAKEQRIALLTRISQNEMNAKTPEETFFKELKARTAQAYYSSKIGIRTEMEYQGNTYLKEFAGYDAT